MSLLSKIDTEYDDLEYPAIFHVSWIRQNPSPTWRTSPSYGGPGPGNGRRGGREQPVAQQLEAYVGRYESMRFPATSASSTVDGTGTVLRPATCARRAPGRIIPPVRRGRAGAGRVRHGRGPRRPRRERG
jgi:hypothetical protein